MNILLDMITLRLKTGAGEYVRRVLRAVIEAVQHSEGEAPGLYALYDSRRGVAYADWGGQRAVERVDLNGRALSDVVRAHRIDRIFIGCAQYWGHLEGLADLDCEVLCVVHDLGYEETAANRLNIWSRLGDSAFPSLYYAAKRYWRKDPHLELIKPFVSLSRKNPGFRFVAVSDFTRMSLRYHYGVDPASVPVLYSPARDIFSSSRTECEELEALVRSGRRYYLLISADRPMKNAAKAIKAFGRFSSLHPDILLVTVGNVRKTVQNQVVLPFLSEADLDRAYRNCYALIYPSLMEGFGYPPLEAMKYGKPVLCSNVCSMPEILGDAPIYFSPFYETDIFRALHVLRDDNYAFFAERSRSRQAEVAQRQVADLNTLVHMILK